MSKTKFMVIKFRELLKTAAFAILGVVIIIALIYFLVPKGNKTASYTPGTYTSKISFDNETINVEVSVNASKIKSVKLIYDGDTVPVFYPLFESVAEDIGKEIVKKQTFEVSVPREAPVTGQLILDAVKNSVTMASASKS